jgi:pimeloyl-ACP methyl ester carboxylesterase
MKFTEAVTIRPSERDRLLDLLCTHWTVGPQVPEGWTPECNLLTRPVTCGEDPEQDLFEIELTELMLRFPSAPIHGAQRLHEYHADLYPSETMHTFRVLKDPDLGGAPSRIVLMHNGLNERDDAVLYYQLAAQLIGNDRGTVCLLRPFPGHLSRFPWDKYGETPLDRYLWDGSHLFRQFLRYMIETQWLLSAIVGPAQRPSAAGAPLLSDEGAEDFEGCLGRRIMEAWEILLEESRHALREARHKQARATRLDSANPTVEAMSDSVHTLRTALGLDGQPSPSLHALGYSLGGFTAQSVFMTWPSLVSSCSTLLSGGPLRALAPTAFAHPEEWQTVLHSLRYELDDGMMDKRYEDRGRGVVGLESSLFHHFQRAFYEVFQQEYHGSFQSRLAAFGRRMFFVVGGKDPIVSPKAVIESAPADGINVLEIGGMGHFLGRKAKGEEQEQRRFWIPQIGRLIHEFSIEAADMHSKELQEAILDLEKLDIHDGQERELEIDGRALERLTEKERLALPSDGALTSGLFGRYLDDLLAQVEQQQSSERSGFLWIFRNEVPTIMLDDYSLLRRAQAMFHDERTIAHYCAEVHQRRAAWQRTQPRTIVVLPWSVERILVNQDAEHGFSSQAETSMGPRREPMSTEQRIDALRAVCLARTEDEQNRESILVFDGRAHIRRQESDSTSLLPPSLPDCWLYTSADFLGIQGSATAEAVKNAFVRTAADHGDTESNLATELLSNELRLITVSRARFNPRFRGRLLTNLKGVRELIGHAGLCLAEAKAYRDFDFTAEDVYPRVQASPPNRILDQRAGKDRRSGKDRRAHNVPVASDLRCKPEQRQDQRRKRAAMIVLPDEHG